MKLWSGIVHVQEHRLTIYDGADEGPAAADVDAGSDDFLQTYGDGVLVIHTGIYGGPVQLDIELGVAAGNTFGHVDVCSGTLLIEDLDPIPVNLPAPGIYRVAVTGVGQSAAPDLQADQVVEAYRVVVEAIECHSFASSTPARSSVVESSERQTLLSRPAEPFATSARSRLVDAELRSEPRRDEVGPARRNCAPPASGSARPRTTTTVGG